MAILLQLLSHRRPDCLGTSLRFQPLLARPSLPPSRPPLPWSHPTTSHVSPPPLARGVPLYTEVTPASARASYLSPALTGPYFQSVQASSCASPPWIFFSLTLYLPD